MRLVGISLLALILVGAVFALSLVDSRRLAHMLLQRVAEPVPLVFDAVHSELEPLADSSHRTRVLMNRQRPVILSGLPSYQGIRFELPRDARPTAGRLRLALTAQVLPGTEAVLRVQIGGVKRGEVLLQPRTRREALEIELSGTDLAGDALKISLSLLGKGPTGPCDGEAPLSTTVEIEPISALHLTLSGPIETPRDLVASWGGTARIGWPAWLEDEERGRRLALAADLLRKSGRAVFLEAGTPEWLDTTSLRRFLSDWPDQRPRRLASPLSLAVNGPNAGLRRFVRQTRWRSGVGARDLGPGLLPKRLDLSIDLGPLPPLTGWVLDVTLDGRLIHAEVVQSASGTYKRSLDLPEIALKPGAQIEVTATSSMVKQGVCDEGPELIAEMRADSRIHLRRDINSLPTQLRGYLANAKAFGIDVLGALTPPEATAIAQALATTVPLDTNLRIAKTARAGIIARVISGAAIAELSADLVLTWRVIPGGLGEVIILPPGVVLASPTQVLISFDDLDSGAAG